MVQFPEDKTEQSPGKPNRKQVSGSHSMQIIFTQTTKEKLRLDLSGRYSAQTTVSPGKLRTGTSNTFVQPENPLSSIYSYKCINPCENDIIIPVMYQMQTGSTASRRPFTRSKLQKCERDRWEMSQQHTASSSRSDNRISNLCLDDLCCCSALSELIKRLPVPTTQRPLSSQRRAIMCSNTSGHL